MAAQFGWIALGKADSGEMQISNRFNVPFALAFLAVALAALIAIVGMTFWLGERAQIYFAEVIEARDTRAAVVELRNAVQTAEASQRGFLLTGNEIYLAPYDTAKTLSLRQLKALERILASYARSNVLVQRLTTIINEKFGEMDRTIALKRDQRDDEAMAIIRTNRGKALSDEANVFFSGAIRAADERLTTGVAEQRENASLLRTFSIVGGFIIVAVVGGAVFLTLRYTRALRQARDEVNLLNLGLEERVKERTADLERVNDEIRRFAYIVTHDLRAPLVNIMGFTAELESVMESIKAVIDRQQGSSEAEDPLLKNARIAVMEDIPEAIGFIRSSTRKMDGLINAILKLAREGRRTPRPERFNLAELIESSVAAIQHQLTEAGGKIDLNVRTPPIFNDRLSFEQILGNLLDNAVKYRAKDRPLHIEVKVDSAPGDRLRIEVSDNGRGIADQDRERVFEMFRRSGVQDKPGEGIGLAYVRAVVRNLGGEILMISALERGTTFRVVLPRDLKLNEGATP
jgi:signal transduction histidine kinase